MTARGGIQITGRILVIPPPAVLYLLIVNKDWDDNRSTVEEYFDFERLRLRSGVQTMTMKVRPWSTMMQQRSVGLTSHID